MVQQELKIWFLWMDLFAFLQALGETSVVMWEKTGVSVDVSKCGLSFNSDILN